MVYPESLPISPISQPPIGSVQVPGSKSITNRALVLAALSSRGKPITLTGALQSEDTEIMVNCLRQLGFRITADWPTVCVEAAVDGPLIPVSTAELYVGNSGTTVRFLTAMLGLGNGRYRLDGVARMRERPIADLLSAMAELGVWAESELGSGCPPVVVHAQGWKGGRVHVRGDVSSQFLSGLLLAAPFAPVDTTIHLSGSLVSEPYVEMTLRMLQQWGLSVRSSAGQFHVTAQSSFIPPASYAIEPDASAASYFWAVAAITGGTVRVCGLGRDSLQGDVAFANVLEQMGCQVTWEPDGIAVRGGSLRGVDVNMNAMSDTVMTLAAVALFADGPTTIRDVAHIRHKETDRISALANELRRLGATVTESVDGLTIIPGPLHGATVQTYQDHRMAMSLALVGLRQAGVVIHDPGCVVKTYPHFFEDLAKLTKTPL